MNDMLKKHRYLKRCLSRYYAEIPDITDPSHLNVLLDGFTNTFKAFKDNYESLVLVLDDLDFDKYQEEFETFQRNFEVNLGDLRSRLKEPVPLSGLNSSDVSTVDIKLPPLELPVFRGTAAEWPSFVDLFNSAVGAHGQISAGQKLQYLKSCMRGEAANIIRHLPTTDAAYAEAWALLKTRFENCREIINGHLNKLFHHENISGNPSSLRRLLDCSNECRNAIELLKQSKEDALLNYILWEKLDQESKQSWELSLKDDKIPKHSEMVQFLEHRARALINENKQQEKSASAAASTNSKINVIKCPSCRGNHFAFTCDRFLQSSVKERETLVKAGKLCFNCLKPNHGVGSCTSRGCKKCKRSHHTLLHKESSPPAPSNFSSLGNKNGSSVKSGVLLATAIVHLKDSNGKKHDVRALLDLGSTVSFITEEMANILNLRKKSTNLTWTGVGGRGHGATKIKVDITASSTVDENFIFQTEAYVIRKITESHPQNNIRDTDEWSHIKGLKLADPRFFEPRSIDLLIGADVLPQLMREGIRKEREDLPIAQNTALGWVLFGSTPQPSSERAESFFLDSTLEYQAKKFWEMEDVESSKVLSPEEQECEDFFTNSVKRDSTGRYIVKLPFKEGCQIPENRSVAFNRFLSLEKKFLKNENFKREYISAIKDFQERNHLIPAKKNNQGVLRSYLPHHAVIKADNETTKIRIVFDASAKDNDGLSLNDALMNGARLQDDLINILLRFRKHQIVFTADIEKMYRQIKLDESNFNYHRIFWREENTLPIQEYYLTTVTFGIKPAPYLATRVLQQLAEDEMSKFPEASRILKTDFYVDDLLTGCNTLEEAEELCHQLDQLLATGGFTLRKWASNKPRALKSIPRERKSNNQGCDIDEGNFVKTLGLRWNPGTDSFSFKVNELSIAKEVTKRKILSDICRTFDPLGWLSPFTITGKIIFQELWKESLNWDDQVPQHIRKQWTTFKEEERTISEIVVPRKIISAEATTLSLCGFADASEKAYSAVVYLRGVNADGEVQVRLVAAKTRVAPLKCTTIPRLELNAALLLAKLIARISKNINVHQIFAWTDSTVVLAWIRGDPSKWKSYVAHRVVKISEIVRKGNWFHITSENNPADCASRGIGGRELKDKEIWWNGPKILYQNFPDNIPEPLPSFELVREESKSKHVLVNHVNRQNDFLNELLHKFSKFSKLLRVTAYVLRFLALCRKGSAGPESAYLTCKEIQAAERFWIKVIQQEHFPDECYSLKRGQNLPKSSRIISLNPFLDDEGFLRVGGRLQNAPIGFEQRHPFLLPQKSYFTILLIQHFHILHCHTGCTSLLATLRRKYWIVNGKQVVRKILIECLKCHRLKAKGVLQKMASLPPCRVSPAPAFNTCGVDFAGPVTLKGMTGRTGTHKGYIAVFVCFSTKAMHLELVSALTTQAFIAALRRFVARRGLCYTIYSDCGTNFVGANTELRKMLKLAQEDCRNEEVAKILSEQGIQWRFNPPGSPHFGGLWEAGVKSVKTHLYRILGKVILNFEEMTTVLTQIESCLNSRPLSEMSSDPTDFAVLTPGHFLIGRPLNALPEPDLTNHAEHRLARFQFCQKIVQNFWKRWSSEYMSRLQCRPKWLSPKTNLKVGQLVLLIEQNLSPLLWKLGRITELHPGSDGLVRVVSVRTSTGIKKRCVQKIAALPLSTCE